MLYYYTDSTNQARGPVTLEQLQALAVTESIYANSLVVPVGGEQWSPIATLIPTVLSTPTFEPLAIISFVMSLAGFACCAIFFIPAIVCGHLALKNIRQQPRLQGKPFAIAGLIISYCLAAFILAYLLFLGGLFLLNFSSASPHH